MGRPFRIQYPGALYHITSRGNEKDNIFLDDSDRLKFLGILKDYHERFGILIHSYVLMDNHYHLIIETPAGNLLKVMHGINSGYTGYFNRKYNRVGHLFQGRYKGILVDKDVYLLQLSKYVHLNPVRAKIIQKPELYKWSSYQEYVWKNKEAKWVEYSWILSKFGRNKEEARKKYKEFVNEGTGTGVENSLKNLYKKTVLGGDEFIEKIKESLKGKPISSEIVERKRLIEYPKPDEIIRAVAKVFSIKRGDVKGNGSRDNTARKVAIYLIKRYAGLSNQATGELFGIHYSAVSKVSGRLKAKMKDDKRLFKLIERLVSNVKT